MWSRLILRRKTFSTKVGPLFIKIFPHRHMSSNMELPREHKYIFRKVRNDSIIKEFCFGLINPQLLKIPDSLQSNSVMDNIVEKLDRLPVDMSTSSGLALLKSIGMFGSLLPCKYGGLGLSMTHNSYLLQHERLADWVLTLVAHQNLCAQTILQYGSEEQKNKYLPRLASGDTIGAFCLTENCSGSDMFAMETVGVLNGLEDHYVVDGNKNWIVNGAIADVMVVFVVTEDSRYEGGRKYLTALIIEKDTKGVSISTPYNFQSLSNSYLADVSFESVFVPIHNVLSEDHGGYKIANHIQNNARYVVGPCVAGWLRILINDLMDKETKLKINNDSRVRHLVNECVMYLYAIESTHFFTTRFSEKIEFTEIELESSAVKVFSMESAKIVVASYLEIIHMLGVNVSPRISILFDRINYLQSFMGSNYFVKLYIGGTMLQLAGYSFIEMKERLKTPIDNFSWLVKSTKSIDRDIIWTDKTDSRYSNVINQSVFISDLKTIFRQLQMSRLQLVKTINRFKETTLEHQYVLEAMSHLGILIYVVSCCVARANTNYGDFEMSCTRLILDHAKVTIDQSVAALISAAKSSDFSLISLLIEDINAADGYPSPNVLHLKKTLFDNEASKV